MGSICSLENWHILDNILDNRLVYVNVRKLRDFNIEKKKNSGITFMLCAVAKTRKKFKQTL